MKVKVTPARGEAGGAKRRRRRWRKRGRGGGGRGKRRRRRRKRRGSSSKVTAPWKVPDAFQLDLWTKWEIIPSMQGWGDPQKQASVQGREQMSGLRDISGLREYQGSGELCWDFPARWQHSVSEGKCVLPAHTPSPDHTTCLGDIGGHRIWTKDHLKKQRHRMESQGVPAAVPSSAHAQPCRPMASGRVKPKWEPAGAPCPPGHPESEPSALEQHSVTNRNANSECAGVHGILDYVLPSSLQASLGGATWFCYIHTKHYNNIVIVLLKLKKRNTCHSGHCSFFDYCSNEFVLLRLLESLREVVHTGHNK